MRSPSELREWRFNMTTSRSIHRLRSGVSTWVLAVAIAGVAQQAWGQTVATTEWRHGTTLSGFLGAASASSDTEVAFGGAVGWELTPHFTVEGRGIWLDAGPRADAFAALLGARIPILPARPVVPFVSGGVGVYRATFDQALSEVPGFYQRRMMSGASEFRGRTFNDFAVALGAGADIFLARHVALRPDVTVLIVTTRSDKRAVPVYGVQLAYHFESHPITPAGRPIAGAHDPR